MKISKRTIFYILLTLLVAFIISCDDRVGTPDIRNEFKKEEKKPDYFGWKWHFKF